MDKVRIDLEYIIKTSPTILFNCLSTPSGLSEWFSDDVNIKDDRYTFFGTVVKKLLYLKRLEKVNRLNSNGKMTKGKIIFSK